MVTAVVVLAALLAVNGIFAMAELAMMTSRPSRLQQAAVRGNRGAATALALARDPTRFLSTVQVGITLIGILAGAISEKALASRVEVALARVPALAHYSGPIALAIVVLVVTYATLVFGELVPKRIAIAHPERAASVIARPLHVLSLIAAWPVWILSVSTEAVLGVLRVRPRPADEVSESDVKALMARAASTGVFDPAEHALLQRVFRASDLTVAALMVPRIDIVWVDESIKPSSLRVLIGTNPYSHFPVCRGGLDQLTGVVHIKDLISHGLLAGEDFAVATIAEPAHFVPETMPALRLLEALRSTRAHVAFVVDEYGVIQGLVTLNDVVAELVGDISRRNEPPSFRAVRREDGSWLLDGSTPVHEAIQTLGISFEAPDERRSSHTVGGLVMDLLGRVPERGERAEWRGWTLEVVDMDGTRVDQILATPPRGAPPNSESAAANG